MTTIALMTVSQVADELGVDRKRIFRLIKKQKIEVQRVGWVYTIPADLLPQIREELGLSNGPLNNSSS